MTTRTKKINRTRKKVEFEALKKKYIRREILLPDATLSPGYVGKVKDKQTSYLTLSCPHRARAGRKRERERENERADLPRADVPGFLASLIETQANL